MQKISTVLISIFRIWKLEGFAGNGDRINGKFFYWSIFIFSDPIYLNTRSAVHGIYINVINISKYVIYVLLKNLSIVGNSWLWGAWLTCVGKWRNVSDNGIVDGNIIYIEGHIFLACEVAA